MNKKTVPLFRRESGVLNDPFCPSPRASRLALALAEVAMLWRRAGPGRGRGRVFHQPVLSLTRLRQWGLRVLPLTTRGRVLRERRESAMASSGWKAALEIVTNNGFITALKEARRTGNLARILVDGNLLHTKLREHDATLVGEDTQGNKYYEKKDNTQFGRHRWVVYADTANYNASAVPPEWHAWLHYITDHSAEQLLELKPTRYGVAHRENLTGRGDGMVYYTKGHALNPNKRDWKRYQSWQPENPDSERKSSETTPNSI